MRRSTAFLRLALIGLSLLSCGGEPRPRVLVLGLDGLDPQIVDLLMSEGKMPNFAELRQNGAYGRLLSEKPLLSPVIWTTLATGKGPAEHGIGHFTAIDQATGEELPATSAMRRVKAVWTMASEAEKTVATVGWWATWPPEEVHGFVVSDHTAYHFLFEGGLHDREDPADDPASGEAPKTHPAELFERIRPLLRRPGDLTREDLAPYVDVSAEDFARPFDFDDQLAHFKWALATAESYRDIGLELWRAESPDLAMVYIEGTDSTSHLFGHLFRAEGLAGELAEQQARYGRAVEEIYLFADRVVGDFLDAMDDDTTLVVLSDHGFELGALHDDPSKTRDLRRVSERFHRLEGILYLYGDQVRRGALLERPTLYDVTPTLLTLLGLPPARDMPGRVLGEALRREVGDVRIATWEGDQDPKAISPQGDRNLAAILFENGRYEESEALYAKLLEGDPDNAALHTSRAGVLGALGRFDEALAEVERAIVLDALNVEAYHNKAVILEYRGEVEAAVEAYRTALRYQPQYEPSRSALARLTGSVVARAPAGEAQTRAAALAEEAADLARHGRYAEAVARLDDARRIAPRFALTFQYRSNVAYLMGDLEGAKEALRQGLEIEPDNALFRENLQRLEAMRR